jgi:hypothetical protein
MHKRVIQKSAAGNNLACGVQGTGSVNSTNIRSTWCSLQHIISSHTVQVRQRVRRALTATRALQRSAPTPSSLLQRWQGVWCACGGSALFVEAIHSPADIGNQEFLSPGIINGASTRVPLSGFQARTNLCLQVRYPSPSRCDTAHRLRRRVPVVLNDSGFVTACDAIVHSAHMLPSSSIQAPSSIIITTGYCLPGSQETAL